MLLLAAHLQLMYVLYVLYLNFFLLSVINLMISYSKNWKGQEEKQPTELCYFTLVGYLSLLSYVHVMSCCYVQMQPFRGECAQNKKGTHWTRFWTPYTNIIYNLLSYSNTPTWLNYFCQLFERSSLQGSSKLGCHTPPCVLKPILTAS